MTPDPRRASSVGSEAWKVAALRPSSKAAKRCHKRSTPGSANWLATVAMTGKSSSGASKTLRLRRTCLRMARRASSLPRFSNLLRTTRSATSSISIFSSCVCAPNSAVITYSEWSATEVIASLPWPMPLVSQKMRSKPTALATSMARSRWSEISEPEPRLASERMNRLPLDRAFMRMRSPKRAPPVRFRVGSTHSKQTFRSGLSRRMRSISSSRRLDLPAPPVPVNPITGTSRSAGAVRALARCC